MDPIRFAVERPVTVSVGVLLIVLFGLIAIGQIPIQLTPNIDTTAVQVTTRWEGATPQDIVNEIIIEQEDKLDEISGLTKVIATATQGQSILALEFEQGITKEQALREVSDKLREVPDYPENVDEPIVEATNPADRDFIAWVVFESTDPDFDVRQLQDFLEDRVKAELKRVPGVSEVNVIGGWEREVQVVVRPMELAARGLTPTMLTDALRRANRDASGGQVSEGKRDIRVRAVGRFSRLDQIESTLLSKPGEPPIYLRDVATVRMGHKDPDRVVRNKGNYVVAVNAQREVGANVVAVMEQFQRKLDDIQKYMLPAEAKRLRINGEFRLRQVYDQTVYIHQAVDLVVQNLWVGGILAVVVLLLFLGSTRPTAIIALAIPTSVVGTFLVMVVTGRSLNVISLAGLAFAVGMVVDNAIVVLENIDRHISLGEKPYTAAYRGTKEVWGAILASTLTTLAVFIPILTVQEEAGQLFRDIAIAICASVALSLIVAVTVIPAAASRWMKPRKIRTQDRKLHGVVDSLLHLPRTITWGIRHTIAALNETWVLRLSIIAVLVAISIVGSYFLMPPTTYLPPGNRNLIFAMLFTPPGTTLEHKMELGERAEQRVRPYWEAAGNPQAAAQLPPAMHFDIESKKLSPSQPAPLTNFFFVALPDRLFMGAISEDDKNVGPTADLLNNTIQSQPAVRGFAIQMPLFRTASQGVGDALELEVSGPDLTEVNHVATMLLGRLTEQFNRVSPTPSNFDQLADEVQIIRSPEKDVRAAAVGLSQDEINTAVAVLNEGLIIGDYLLEGDTVDLKVLAEESQFGDATRVRDLPIATPTGHIITLGQVRDVDRSLAADEISRVEGLNTVTLQLQLGNDTPLQQVMDEIQSEIEGLRESGAIPPTVNTSLEGTAAKLKSVQHALLGQWTGFNAQSILSLALSRMFLAMLVVFLLMVALFENWFYPMVIMVSVPLATVGGFLGLRLVHTLDPTQQLDMLTMLGFVILMGVVVNNAILIVHQSLNLMRGIAEVQVEGEIVEKLPPHQAIAEAVRTRVRPIFMTTATSVGGMLPLVLIPGSGSELYRGLGSVVLGGLVVSTLFTLLLVPLLLGVVFDLREILFGRILGMDTEVHAPVTPSLEASNGPAPVEAPAGK